MQDIIMSITYIFDTVEIYKVNLYRTLIYQFVYNFINQEVKYIKLPNFLI